MQLRRFDESDYALLVSWLPTADDLYRMAGTTATWPLDARQLNCRTANQTLSAWTAVEDGTNQAWGHIELVLRDRISARLEWVLVAPFARGRQLSAPLVEAALAEARKLGTEVVDLLVNEANTPALHTYLRVGFRDCHEPQRDRKYMRRMEISLSPSVPRRPSI